MLATVLFMIWPSLSKIHSPTVKITDPNSEEKKATKFSSLVETAGEHCTPFNSLNLRSSVHVLNRNVAWCLNLSLTTRPLKLGPSNWESHPSPTIPKVFYHVASWTWYICRKQFPPPFCYVMFNSQVKCQTTVSLATIKFF